MANKTNLSIGAVIAVLFAAYFGIDLNHNNNQANSSKNATTVQQNSSDANDEKNTLNQENDSHRSVQNNPETNSLNQHGLQVIRQSFDRKLSNVQVQSVGRVKAVLRDDHEGSRHQKFILSLDNGLTVLVAHNIDLAPRVENLQKGDWVEFFGEYEYSQQGGVIHWTHHDPSHRHEDGWLKHNGKISR